MTSPARDVIDLYERHADAWDRDRSAELFLEAGWIERFLQLLPIQGTILDMGCGSARPIAKHLIDRGYRVVGVDSSPTLIAKCRARFPGEEWIVGDMRRPEYHREFCGIVAWDSFFHLCREDQRAMFATFREHAADGAPLLFTTGTDDGEAIGSYRGEPLYHASLSPTTYRELLDASGFGVDAHTVEDPGCGKHTVWLARKRPSASRRVV